MTLHTEKTEGPIQTPRRLPRRMHGSTNYRSNDSTMGVLSSAYIRNDLFYRFAVSVDDIEPQRKGSGRIHRRRKA